MSSAHALDTALRLKKSRRTGSLGYVSHRAEPPASSLTSFVLACLFFFLAHPLCIICSTCSCPRLPSYPFSRHGNAHDYRSCSTCTCPSLSAPVALRLLRLHLHFGLDQPSPGSTHTRTQHHSLTTMLTLVQTAIKDWSSRATRSCHRPRGLCLGAFAERSLG